jgi:hypothetical protein
MPVTKSKQGKPLGGIGAERQSSRRHSLVLDDRLLSKQYVASVADNKVDNTTYGIGWDGITDKAPSVNAVYDKINSMGLVTHEWTHESDTTSTKVRSNHTGFYGIGAGSGLAFSDITERLTVDGNIKTTGNIYAGVGESNVRIGLSDNGAYCRFYSTYSKFPAPVMIGAPGNYRDIPFLVGTMQNAQGGTATLKSHTGRMQIGYDEGANMGLDENKIQARLGSLNQSSLSDAVAAKLEFNTSGGDIDLSASGDTTAVKGHMTVAGNATITGNLTVTGSATSISTAQVTMEDPILLLNADSTGADVDSGIEVERGSVLTNRKLFWDEGEDVWKIQTGDSTFTEIAGGGGTLTGTNTGDVIINVAAGVPANTFQITAQTVTFADAFIYNTGTANKIGVDGGADGKLSLFGTEGGSGTGTSGLIVKGGNSEASAPAVDITGALVATTKSFNIPHPLNSNKRLVYGCLEGPEYGMYQRGSFLVDDERRIVAIDLPNYWFKMVYDDYAINLTTYGDYNVWISDRDENGFWVETNAEGEWNFDWSVIGGRRDAKLVVEPDG